MKFLAALKGLPPAKQKGELVDVDAAFKYMTKSRDSRRVYQTFTACYYDLVEELMNDFTYESAPRGMQIKEKLGVTFELTNPRNRLPYIPEREFGMAYCIAECVWYLTARNDTDWIANYAPFWRGISDDGKTANSAYGARLFRPHPRIAVGQLSSQWRYAIDELKRDSDSRRAVMHIRTPCDSMPGAADKDMPCTLTLHPFVRDGKLHLVANMRSSDLILGIAYDVPFFTLLQELMAAELGVGLGSYIHTSNSLHVYEKHYKMCDAIIAGKDTHSSERLEMPAVPSAGFEAPVGMLDIIQARARMCDDPSKLIAIVNESPLVGYWDDWARILVMHRARKLKALDVFEQLRNSLEFKGYSLFDR